MIITKEELKNLVYVEQKTQRAIAKEYGCSESWISGLMKIYGIRKKIEDRYIGKKFGDLTVIKKYGKKDSHTVFECVCSCGKLVYLKSCALVTGNTKSCGCTSRKRGKNHPNYKGYEDIKKCYFWTIENGAKTRGLEFTITIEYAWNLYVKQGKKCALTGKPIYFATTNKNRKFANASLDRIDSAKGYIPGNIQWLDKKVNHMKWDLNQQDFIENCKMVAEYNK